MDVLSLALPVALGLIVLVFMYMNNRRSSTGRNVCNRCSGTGEVNEKWPDPDKAGGWHIADGVCPKCKGKGRF